MSQTTIPRTPTPEALHSDGFSSSASPTQSKNLLPGIHSYSAADMTPPPSTQFNSSNTKSGHATFSRREALGSPPSILRAGPPITMGTLFGEVPTMDVVDHMNEDQLRQLASQLIPALHDARTSDAHSRLQYKLLAFENDESIKRAEVEHEATRREVQFLQESSPAPHHGFSPTGSPQASAHRNVQSALSHCRDLQYDNARLEKRLRSAKRLIAQLHGHNSDCKEHIDVLRQRIKDNRQHMKDLQESGVMSINTTPRQDYSTPHIRGTPRTPATARSAMFDSLIQAANNVERSSVPPNPSVSRQRGLDPHRKGVHSLSSLPATPERRLTRPVTADNTSFGPVSNHHVSFSAPGTRLTYGSSIQAQDDRESTVSASDNEEDKYQEDSLPGSQASQMASSMLRRTLEAGNDRSSPSKTAPSAGKKIQSKICGQVVKPRMPAIASTSKRRSSHDGLDEPPISNKKAKMQQLGDDRIGLGIGSWLSPSR